MRTKYIVQSLWIDSVIGDLQVLCLKSFLEKGIQVNLYTYTDIVNAPQGVNLCDANTIIDCRYIFKDITNSYATFSDWFRIKLLDTKGGWWVDCDVFCLRPFDFLNPYVFATEAFNYYGERHLRICNAVIKMPKKSLLGKRVLFDIKQRLGKDRPEDIPWTEIGAQILAHHISMLDLTKYIVASETFCPNDFKDYKDLSEKDGIVFGECTYGVHLWNKMWEWNNDIPLKQPKENSFLGKIVGNNSVD